MGKKVIGVHHVLTHRGKEEEVEEVEVEEVVVIIRMDPTIITIMGPIPQQAVEDQMDKNQDRVINAGKQATGAPIVPKPVVVATKEIRLIMLVIRQTSCTTFPYPVIPILILFNFL